MKSTPLSLINPNQKIELLPTWIESYCFQVERFLVKNGLSIEEACSTKPDEYIKYDLCYENPRTPMFIAIFENYGKIYYHIDCGIVDLAGLDKDELFQVYEYCMKTTWNLLLPYRATINSQGHLSLNTIGELRRLTKTHFRKLIEEIAPYAKQLNDELKIKFE